MKKIVILLGIALIAVSCNEKNPEISNEFKTAYIDTSTLMKESTEAKDIEAKYKDKAAAMGAKLKTESESLEAEKNNFKANAQKNGEAWAQNKYGELQQRSEKLQYAQQSMLQQLQEESGVEMDSLVTKYKRNFKDFAKNKGYDYLFGTGESATVLYAKDKYDITKDMIKEINGNYNKDDKKEEKPEIKK